jgi:hypothetical protein
VEGETVLPKWVDDGEEPLEGEAAGEVEGAHQAEGGEREAPADGAQDGGPPPPAGTRRQGQPEGAKAPHQIHLGTGLRI